MNRQNKLFRVMLVAAILALVSLLSFIIPGNTPDVSAEVVSPRCDRATLQGFVDPNNTTNAVGWFEWGTSSTPSFSTPEQPVPSPMVIRQEIIGLSGNTTYYYRVMSSNDFGVTTGQIDSFRTPACGGTTPVQQAFNVACVVHNAITR